MDIYVKNVKLPTNCDYCTLDSDCPHSQSIDGYKMQGGRPHTCPLVAVPPHGRLIDADAVTDAAMDDILMWEEAGCDRDDYRAFLANYIEDAPTIIPASEEGKTDG